MLHTVLFFLLLHQMLLLAHSQQVLLTTNAKSNSSANKNLIKSFIDFKNNVKSLFLTNTKKLLAQSRRFKKAFLKFINEVFGDNLNKTTTTRTQLKTEEEQNTHRKIVTDKLIVDNYQSESHTVLTEDGYILTIQRILPFRNQANNKLILLHHGLLGSSEDWLLLGPDKCLPCLLTKIGYEVWLVNARGNRNSKLHINKTNSMPEYWNFSWHEMGLYDLTETIHYIREYTNDELEMHFIGHSMGATALLVLLSILPHYNELLKSAVLLGPLAYMYNIKGLMRMLAEAYTTNDIDYYAEKDEFKLFQEFPREIIKKFCKGNERSCSNPLLLLVNGGEEMLDMDHMENILNYVPAGGSVKTIIHYGQLVKSGNFQMYDYGLSYNLIKYGDYNPPMYNLTKVTLPVTIFYSRDDWLSTTEDIKKLIQQLRNVISHHEIPNEGFSHTDFVWGLDAPKLIFVPILDIYKEL